MHKMPTARSEVAQRGQKWMLKADSEMGGQSRRGRSMAKNRPTHRIRNESETLLDTQSVTQTDDTSNDARNNAGKHIVVHRNRRETTPGTIVGDGNGAGNRQQ